MKRHTLIRSIADVLLAYAKAQFLLAVIVAVIVWIVLRALGVGHPFALAVFSGILSSVPLIGMGTAAVVSGIVSAFDRSRFIPDRPEFVEGFAVLGIYIALNLLMDYVVSPYLIGKRLEVHPLLILLSVILGTAMFGIAGTLFAVPAVLVAKTVAEYVRTSPEDSQRHARKRVARKERSRH